MEESHSSGTTSNGRHDELVRMRLEESQDGIIFEACTEHYPKTCFWEGITDTPACIWVE